MQAYLARINEVNINGPGLRAIKEVNPFAVNQAVDLDSERRKIRSRGRLHRIPIMLKDNIATEYEKYRRCNLFLYFPSIYHLRQV